MSRQPRHLSALALAGLLWILVNHSACAQTNWPNRLTLSGRMALGIRANFSAVPASAFSVATRRTPQGAPYNYDDGYVLTDSTGNAGGQTWYWGYDSPGQISGNTILMDRSTLVGGTRAVTADSAPNYGADILYSHPLYSRADRTVGFEVGLSYLNVSFVNNDASTALAATTTDAYGFTPGTTPPATPPSYQGAFNGPGFLLSASPSSSTSGRPGAVTSAGQRTCNADLFGFRVGPCLQFSLFDVPQLTLTLSGGFAAAWMQGTASWSEAARLPSGAILNAAGQGNDSAFLMGGYLSGQIAYQFSPRWSVAAGAQFENLGSVSFPAGASNVQLQFGSIVYVNLGVGYSF